MSRLRDSLLRYEGIRLKPYRCTQGRLTIGIGRNLDDVGISSEEAHLMLDNDIKRVKADADRELIWFDALDEVRQYVVLLMLFQLGPTTFRKFRRFIRAMDRQDYEIAAKEMLASDWAKQTPARAQELAMLMLRGE